MSNDLVNTKVDVSTKARCQNTKEKRKYSVKPDWLQKRKKNFVNQKTNQTTKYIARKKKHINRENKHIHQNSNSTRKNYYHRRTRTQRNREKD